MERCSFVIFLTLALCATPGPGQTSGGAPTAVRTFSDLPLLARYAGSRIIGREVASYHVERAPNELRMQNARHGFAAAFNTAGVSVEASGARLGLRLAAVGYGTSLEPVPRASLAAERNRVLFRRGSLTEWYVNGPIGLQQGFTLERAPAGPRRGALTLSLRLDGDYVPRVDEDGRGVTLEGGHDTLRYSGLTAFDASGRTLDAQLAAHGGQLVIRVDDRGARYPVVVDPYVEKAKLTASSGAAGDNLGQSVAMSGDTVVLGASGHGSSGAAFVFVKPPTGWAAVTEVAKLTSSDGVPFDLFGSSVSISGDTVVVGDPAQDRIGANEGAAYVFVRPATGWKTMTETAKLTAADAASQDSFGWSVAIDGTIIVVGAPFHDVNASNSGAVYVFERPRTGWATMTQTSKLTASDGNNNDQLGGSVAIAGGTVVAGAPFHAFTGAAYVFVRPPAGWGGGGTQTSKLLPGPVVFANAGRAVAIDADTVVVGTPGASSARGEAYVFVKPGAGWPSTIRPTAVLRASDGASGDQFGAATAIAGNTVVIGSPADDDNGTDSGSAYVFVKPSAGWATMTETTKLRASDGAAVDVFGSAVGINGDTIVAGAPNNGGRGAAYVFPSTFLNETGSSRVGGLRRFTLGASSSPSLAYQMSTALSANVGFAIDDRLVGLDPDALFFLSTPGILPAVFAAYSGSLDSSGHSAAPRLNIPNDPLLVGLTPHSAFATLKQGAPSGIFAISNTTSFTITP